MGCRPLAHICEYAHTSRKRGSCAYLRIYTQKYWPAIQISVFIFFYWSICSACLCACVYRHIVNNGLHFKSGKKKSYTELFQAAVCKRPNAPFTQAPPCRRFRLLSGRSLCWSLLSNRITGPYLLCCAERTQSRSPLWGHQMEMGPPVCFHPICRTNAK